MTRVDSRVRRLELAHGSGECPECSFDGDWSKVEFKTELGGGPPKWCGTCVRPLVIVVGWGEGGPAA